MNAARPLHRLATGDLRAIQAMLGHADLGTTEIYTRVARITSSQRTRGRRLRQVTTLSGTDETALRHLLEQWAETTRTNRLDEVLVNHAEDALIYDVLPPLKYEGAAAYRRSWGDWHPEAVGEGQFGWKDQVITCDAELAFAHGVIVCIRSGQARGLDPRRGR